MCYDSCPTGTYVNGAECSACPSNCDVCSSGTVCTTCSSGFYLSSVNNKCYNPCPAGTYLSGSTCSGCSTGCSTCTSSTACTACQSGYYLYDDGSTQSCYNPCPSTLVADTTTNTCTTSCPAGTYLDSGVCESCVEYCTSCSSATSCSSCSGGRTFTNGACVLPTSCVGTNCVLTLSLKLTSDPLGFLLIFNQEVQEIIDSLTTTLAVKLGNEVFSNSQYYLQKIDSKSAIIRFPTTQTIESKTTLFCQVSLSSSLTANFTEVNNNASITVDRYIPLSASENSASETAANFINYQGKITSAMVAVGQIGGLSMTSSLFAAFGSDMIQMFRFSNVKFPANMMAVFNNSLPSPVSISIPIDMSSFESIGEAIEFGVAIPDGQSLERYEVNRYYLNNFLECIVTIILLLIFCGVFRFASRYRKKMHRRIAYVVDKADVFFSWNFTISCAFSHIIKLYFYSSVYLWYIDIGTANGIVNILASIATIVLSIGLIVWTIKYLKNAKCEELKEPDLYNLSDRYRCLYEGIKHDTPAQKFYVPALVIRGVLFGLLMSLMRYQPLPQSILLCIMNTAFLIYLIAVRAAELTSEMIAQAVTEMVMSGMSYSIFALAVIDADNSENDDIRSRIGVAILVLNFVLIGVEILISIQGGISTLKWLITGIINARKKKNSVMPIKIVNKENISIFNDGLGDADLVSGVQEPSSKPTIILSPLADKLDLDNTTKGKESGLNDRSSFIYPTPLRLKKSLPKRAADNMFLDSPENSPMNSYGGASPLLREALVGRRTPNQKSHFEMNNDLPGTRISMSNINLKEGEENEIGTPTTKNNIDKSP